MNVVGTLVKVDHSRRCLRRPRYSGHVNGRGVFELVFPFPSEGVSAGEDVEAWRIREVDPEGAARARARAIGRRVLVSVGRDMLYILHDR
jgi:hypothetical protein